MSIWKTTVNKFKTSFWIPLSALLWKYVKLQFYRFRHTFWELFGSILVFVILFLLHQINISTPGLIIDIKPTNLIESQPPLVRVFYEPYNNFTRRLMNQAEQYLNQNSDLNQTKWEFESIGFPINFHDHFFDTNNGIAQVKFKSQGSLTTDLDYSLSVLSDVAKSNLDVAFGGVFSTNSPKVELAPSYLGDLQWAIDKSYIEQLTSEDIDTFLIMTAITDVIKDELLTLKRFILICTILGPMPFYLVIASKMVDEQRSGMKELMKQAGISANMWRFAYYLESLIAAILYSSVITTLLKVSSKPILKKSNAFIIGFTTIFHFVNSMCLAFVTTIVCQNIRYSDCIACLTYLMAFILEFLWNYLKEYTFLFYYVLPHAPMYLFWDEILYLEKIGEGSQFQNIFTHHSDNFTVAGVWIVLLVQQIITITLAWYLDQVKPGYYGIAKRFYFPFKKNYWHPINKRKRIELPPYLLFHRDEAHFQKIPKNVEIAVQILNVSKAGLKTYGELFKVAVWKVVFGPNYDKKVFEKANPKVVVNALDSVSFNCCRGEVTVLLGGNGAGKSTLLLIVAGMLSVTDGAVFVDGFQVGGGIMEHRQSLRICLQKDMSFRYLTVKENIMFFSKLRKTKEGFSVDHLLKKLKLFEISDHYGHHLSAGRLKCLQVACVLAGDADVLLLDEPTTGIEMEVRLRLWDMLMVLRGNKTIIIATSCLEEANALGDRIVLLDNGVLRCHGSPTFIKNIIGTCFTLSIIIADSARLYDLKELVDSIIPDLECHIHDMRRIVFSLPTSEFDNFPKLLEALEERRGRLGIVHLDVGMFIKEVFEKFVNTSVHESASLRRRSGSSSDTALYRMKITGSRLKWRQTIMLTLRILDNILMQRVYFLTLRFLVPIFCLINITLTSNYSLKDRMFYDDSSMITSEIAKIVHNIAPTTLRSRLLNGVDKFPGVEAVYLENIDDEFMGASEVHSIKETVGFEITDVYIRIVHPIDPRLTSKTVNMFSNIYMSMYVPNNNNTIRTSYESLAKPKPTELKDVKSSFLCLKWSSWVTFLSMFPIAPTIILCIWERKLGIRDNHMMAGCTPIVHWTARLIAHMTIFLFVLVIPLLIICVFMDFDRTFLQAKFLGCLIAMLLMFALAFHSYLYAWSFRRNEYYAVCQIYVTSLFFGVVLPVLVSVLEVFAKKLFYFAVPYYILEIFARLNPMYALGTGMAKLTLRARLNSHCHLNKHMCPNLKFDDEYFNAKICCSSKLVNEPFPYLASYETGMYDILTLFVQFVVYWIVVILLEYKILQTIREKIVFHRSEKPKLNVLDTRSVLQERLYVETAVQEKNYVDNVFLVKGVHKYYTDTDFTTKKIKSYAVQGITYATQQGECLAILGTQSSGKTTLMNMLAGNTVMTKGDSCIQGTFLSQERMKYMHKVCLSSSTGGMDHFMTGLDNLVFVAKLHGYSDKIAYFLALKALTLMGLMKNKVVVSEYSVGCLRRLSLCSVLVLTPPVAFLDEPMTEIDAISKSLVAKAIIHLKGEPAAIIVTDQTLDWTLMQQVFDRIAIMSKGKFVVIGPADEVLDSIASGYSARIKLRMVTAYRRDRYHSAADDDSDSDLEEESEQPHTHSAKSVVFAQSLINFKADFLKAFPSSRLCSEHLCMLFFYISDKNKTLRYSAMFRKLQILKENYLDLVEDYILTFTTVEDFFWALEYELGPKIEKQAIPPMNDVKNIKKEKKRKR